ncbi:MAG: replication initiator protein A [Lachnospiraceae bacterium]|nr:replication initiator protein A [Lachnospiraceae bacterium]
MTYQYFTPGDAEQYAYYRIPKMLITDKQFRGITMEAKLLYGILLDRVSLSLKNGWVDENNHVYIIFTIEQIMQEMNCGNKKAVSLLSELEKKIHLVEKKRQGLGKPNLLYVKNFFLCSDINTDGTEIVDNYPSVGKRCAEMSEGNAQRCQKDTSVGVVEEALEVSKGHGTNTNITKTDMSNTDPILSYPSGDGNSVKEPEHRIDGYDGMNPQGKGNSDMAYHQTDLNHDEYEAYRQYFLENLSLETLKFDHPSERDTLDGILDLLVETCCSTRKTIRIAGEDKPIAVVKSKFMKLDSEHIRYVLQCLSQNVTYVRNIRQYLLTTLYNAPSTIGPYYRALVNHDMANGFI